MHVIQYSTWRTCNSWIACHSWVRFISWTNFTSIILQQCFVNMEWLHMHVRLELFHNQTGYGSVSSNLQLISLSNTTVWVSLWLILTREWTLLAQENNGSLWLGSSSRLTNYDELCATHCTTPPPPTIETMPTRRAGKFIR